MDSLASKTEDTSLCQYLLAPPITIVIVVVVVVTNILELSVCATVEEATTLEAVV
jgi:hypothetical protein